MSKMSKKSCLSCHKKGSTSFGSGSRIPQQQQQQLRTNSSKLVQFYEPELNYPDDIVSPKQNLKTNKKFTTPDQLKLDPQLLETTSSIDDLALPVAKYPLEKYNCTHNHNSEQK